MDATSVPAVDLDHFANPDFNTTDWINSILQPSHTADQATEVIAQLQHASHNTSRQVSQITNSVISSMPRIMDELKNLEKQVQHSMCAIKTLENSMKQEEPAHLEQLRQLHNVKTRMEQTRIALNETENDDVGDNQRVGE